MNPITATQPAAGPFTMKADSLKRLKVHMIGIGGSGMSGLAALLQRHGARVSGTDAVASPEFAALDKAGVAVSTQQDGSHLPAELDLVVASAAVPADHPELRIARERGVRQLKYAEMLGMVMNHHHGIAIAGTHGKSTTSAWLACVLKQAGLDPSFVIGANVEQLGGGSGVGDGPHFVAEACEYDRSFLNLHPRLAAILNIEEDHLDYYEDLAGICDAFGAFARGITDDGLLITNADNANCAALAGTLPGRVCTFAVNADADWQPRHVRWEAGCARFEAMHAGTRLGTVELGLPGQHNLENALAVAALATECGVPWDSIATGLASFRGASRRLQLRGEKRGIQVVDDYAHHPTELRVTLDAARKYYQPRRLWCVFQPHQHSRTRFLLADFADSFAAADHVIVPDIYFVRDTERDRAAVNAADLVDEIKKRGGDATYVPDFSEIATRIAADARTGDLVITMGAGPIWRVADELLRRLGGDLPG